MSWCIRLKSLIFAGLVPDESIRFAACVCNIVKSLAYVKDFKLVEFWEKAAERNLRGECSNLSPVAWL